MLINIVAISSQWNSYRPSTIINNLLSVVIYLITLPLYLVRELLNEEFYATGPSSALTRPTKPFSLLLFLSFSNCSASNNPHRRGFESTSGVRKANKRRVVVLGQVCASTSPLHGIFVFSFSVFGPSLISASASHSSLCFFFFFVHFLTSASPASSVVFFLIILHIYMPLHMRPLNTYLRAQRTSPFCDREADLVPWQSSVAYFRRLVKPPKTLYLAYSRLQLLSTKDGNDSSGERY